MNDTETQTRTTQPEIILPPTAPEEPAGTDTQVKRAAIAYITGTRDGVEYILAVYNHKHKAWSLPGGKFEADKDVDLMGTVKRELLEETGLVGISAKEIYHSRTYVRVPTAYGCGTEADSTMVTVFEVQPQGIPIALEPNQAVGWVTREFLEGQDHLWASMWFTEFFSALDPSHIEEDEECDEDAYEDDGEEDEDA